MAGQKGMKWIFIVIGIVILIAIIGAVGGDGDESKSVSSSSSSSTSSKTEQIYTVGEPFETKKFEITVTKVSKRSKVGDEFWSETPAEGAVYVAVQWKYKNITEDPISSFSTPDIYIITPKGKKLKKDTGASVAFSSEVDSSEKALSDLNPGITASSADVFEVAESMISEGDWALEIEGKKVSISF